MSSRCISLSFSRLAFEHRIEERIETSTTQVPPRCNEKRREASTIPVPHFALFAHKALLEFEAMNSNNAKCGTSHDEARSADRV